MLTLGLSHTGTRSTGREADAIRDEEDRSSFVSLLKKEFKVFARLYNGEIRRKLPQKHKGRRPRVGDGYGFSTTHSTLTLPIPYLKIPVWWWAVAPRRPQRGWRRRGRGWPLARMIRVPQVSPRPRERAGIHSWAVWAGRGRAVWVSHPGQVGDRAGQLCGSVRAGRIRVYGRAGQGRAGQFGEIFLKTNKNLNKTTLSHSTQARHRCELARASTITGTPPEPPKRLR